MPLGGNSDVEREVPLLDSEDLGSNEYTYIITAENLKNTENHKAEHFAYNLIPRNNHLTFWYLSFPCFSYTFLK